MRILIAEDEVEIARALKVLLEKNKCSVDIVHNGKDAWDYISQGKFDVVVLDIMMPEMDGLEVLRKMRDSHDDAGFGARGDLEFVGHGRGIDREGVVAGDGQWQGDAFEHAAPVVGDDGGLAVHELGCVPHGRAEQLAQGLMAQAHTQHRNAVLGAVGNSLQGRAGALGVTGSGGNEDAVVAGLEPRGIHDVVTHDVHNSAQVAQVAHNREDERVVVVDAEDSCHRRSFHVRGRGPFLRPPS